MIKRVVAFALSVVFLLVQVDGIVFSDTGVGNKVLDVIVDGANHIHVETIDHDGDVYISTESACEMAGVDTFESDSSGYYFSREFKQIIGNAAELYEGSMGINKLRYSGNVIEIDNKLYCSLKESMDFLRARYYLTDSGLIVKTCDLFPSDVVISYIREIFRSNDNYFDIDDVPKMETWAVCSYDLVFNHDLFYLYKGYRYQYTTEEYEDILCEIISMESDYTDYKDRIQIADDVNDFLDKMILFKDCLEEDEYADWYGYAEKSKKIFDKFDMTVSSFEATISWIKHSQTVTDLVYGNVGGVDHVLRENSKDFRISPNLKTAANRILEYYNEDSVTEEVWTEESLKEIRDYSAQVTVDALIDFAFETVLGDADDLYLKLIHALAENAGLDEKIENTKKMYVLNEIQDAAYFYCADYISKAMYSGEAAEKVKYGAILYLQAFLYARELLGVSSDLGHEALIRYYLIDDAELLAEINNPQLSYSDLDDSGSHASTELTDIVYDISVKSRICLNAYNYFAFIPAEDDAVDVYRYDIDADGLLDYIVSYNKSALTYVSLSSTPETPIYTYDSQYLNSPYICRDDNTLYIMEAIASNGRISPFTGYHEGFVTNPHYGAFYPDEESNADGTRSVYACFDQEDPVEFTDGGFTDYLVERMNLYPLELSTENISSFTIDISKDYIHELAAGLGMQEGYESYEEGDINGDGVDDALVLLSAPDAAYYAWIKLESNGDGIAVSITPLFADSDEEPVDTLEYGKLKVATNAYFPPYEYYSGGKIVGVDVEIVEAIAARLNIDVVWQDVELDAIFFGLQNNSYDIGIAGVTETDERNLCADPSYSYATNAQIVIVREGSDISNPDDLVNGNYVVGVKKNTTADVYIVDDIGESRVVRYATSDEALEALSADSVDAVVMDIRPAGELLKKTDGLRVLDQLYASEDYVIFVNKNNPELLNQVNQAIMEMKNDGTIQSILDKYIN